VGAVRANFYKLGETAVAGELDTLLGMVVEFDDCNYSSNAATRKLNSGRRIKAMWVKNDSGSTLNPGECLTWKSGYAGTYVGGVTGAAGTGVGAVDPYVGSAGVTTGRNFWMIIEGPGTARSGAAVAANAIIIPAATGEVVTVTNDAPGSLSACGRCVVAASGADETINVYWKFPGY
jgi:hypothetical protein